MADVSEADPLIGRLVGQKFRIDRMLGAGAMGRVYLAEQTNLGKQVALKVLHNAMAGDAQLAKRFYREAKSASMLSHPNILQIIDFGDDGGLLYIAMELLTGRDLYHVIKAEWPFPMERIGHIGGQILGALDEAHAKGVVHRDLKPENVMLLDVRGESDFVKVCDFGIAKIASERDGEGSAITMAGMVCGTPEYMSPEQARGDALDGRSDLYAAAVILYQMVVSDVPFRAESALGVITKHLIEEPTPPLKRRVNSGLPQALETVIMRGLSKRKEDRFATAAEMKAALLEAVGLRRPSSGMGTAGNSAPLEIAMATTGVATPVATPAMVGLTSPATMLAPTAAAAPPPGATATPPARAAAVASAPSGGSLHGELAAASVPTASGRRRGIIVGTMAIVAALGSAAYMMVGRPSVPATTGAAAASVTSGAGAASVTAVPGTTGAAGAANAPAPTGIAAPASPATSAPGATGVAGATTAPAPAEIAAPASPATSAPGAAAGQAAHRREKAHSAVHGAPAVAASVAAPPKPPSTPAPPTVAAPAAHSFAGAFADGETAFRSGDVDAALARYLEAAKLNPGDARTQRQIGKCYNRLGQRDRAEPYFRRYLQLAPDASDAEFIRADIDGK
ncbi:MAG TPA: protein kinase [Polyangia bacterium]|nr:protein kinase [Polyangia bacterium]